MYMDVYHYSYSYFYYSSSSCILLPRKLLQKLGMQIQDGNVDPSPDITGDLSEFGADISSKLWTIIQSYLGSPSNPLEIHPVYIRIDFQTAEFNWDGTG